VSAVSDGHRPGHAELAAPFVANTERMHWHDQALWFVREKRDRAAKSVPEWEALRSLAAQIKAHTLSRLHDYVLEFEENARRHGAHVHFAADAEEHNAIVLRILEARGVRRLVKSKSMLTEECHLNPFLEAHGIEVVDTDLGERIVQLRGEPPSHIVLPAIHLRRQEVGALFHERLGTERGASDPSYLTEAARQHLRERFLAAEAGLSGVNFAIAETGGIVVCTNEGNADLGTALPRLHIACMGVDKLIPKLEHLPVLLRLLARSATGQPITTYTSHFHGPKPDGELHVVIVDNGRSALLAGPHRTALTCIRCGACLNTCPVYRRSGGHSYGTPIAGPIGSVLASERDPARFSTLPYACSLCASCTDVCPVKVDLDTQLYSLRSELVQHGLLPAHKRLAMAAAGLVFRSRFLYELLGRLTRAVGRRLPRFVLYGPLNIWGRQRELPKLPARSFRELYRQRARK
jgi:L-lactate dehydrogenase complex protein LldF